MNRYPEVLKTPSSRLLCAANAHKVIPIVPIWLFTSRAFTDINASQFQAKKTLRHGRFKMDETKHHLRV